MKSTLQTGVLVLVLISATTVPSLALDSTSSTPAQVQFFETKVRPVLVEHCYKCHSQESDSNGELLLDSRDAVRRGGVSGPAVVPGKAERSLLIAAVRYQDPDFAMPPRESGGKLPDSIIADLVRWVEMGAPDPRVDESSSSHGYDAEKAKSWWAYQPVTSPQVPSTENQEWPVTEIDRFVLAGLEQKSLQPVESADKSSLLRRVFIDLIGLPPPLSYQEKFLASNDDKLYERVVDWLLKQPQFGERWGRHWLDVARYAETTGRDSNLTMPQAWRYRDYVIKAFNDDKPFDEFIVEQIAGDLLRSPAESDRVEKLIATGFLAVGAKGINEGDPRQFAVELADEQIDTMSQAFLGMTVSCARCHDHKFDPITQADYTALAGIFLSTETHFGTAGGVRGRNASDLIEVPSSVKLKTLGQGMSPRDYAEKETELEAITRRRDEALRSRAPNQTPGPRGGESGGRQQRGLQQRDSQQFGAQQTGPQRTGPQQGNRPPRGRQQRGPQRNGMQRGGMQQSDSEVSGFDIVRMMTRAKLIEVELSGFNPDGSVKPMVMGVSDKPTHIETNQRGPNQGGPNQGGQGQGRMGQGRMGQAGPMVGGPNNRGRTSSGFETIADSPLLLRGSIENEADGIPRGIPEFLSHGKKLRIAPDSSGRLELARWIASKENTLTSRVIVNRVWHWLFGSGLVESVDNFGASGTLPSNQALLDHLASRFVSEGWSIKQLIREIVLSRVYQLDSRHNEENDAVDPDNRLNWRTNARRLDAESIRDCVLVASGQLDSKPISGSLIAAAGDGPVGGDRFQAIREEEIAGASGRHRSVYLPIARSVQPESLAVFDFTDPSAVLGSRSTTIVPPQALYLMNGDFMETQAKAMAKRVMKTSGFEARFADACRLTFCREPYPDEIIAAKKMRGDELATWTSICRALLSSADFLFVN